MNILIVTAAPYSGLGSCVAQLLAAGLGQDLPANSPAGAISAQDWHTRLLSAQGLSEPLQVPAQTVVVGKMWEDLAVSLMLANMNQSLWGFADERATWVLNFWASVDPQTRFALGYLPLGQVVTHFKTSHPEASDEQIHQLSHAWVEWNSALLAFAQKMGSRALLFDLAQAFEHPLRLAHTCAKKLNLGALDWQTLKDQPNHPWPEAADLSQLRLPNLGAVRALQKKLDAHGTTLLNPNTQVMASPSSDKSGPGWSLFGLFGKGKQLAQDLNQARFELQKAQAELTQAQERLTDLQAQQEQLTIEHQRQTRLTAEGHKAELEKHQNELKEQRQEGELLLQQLHQVQEELEQIFLNREELKKQLQTAEKAKTDAQAKVADLDKKLKDLEAAKAKAESAATAAEKKAAEAVKKASEALAKASAAEQAKATSDKAKAESDKKAAEADKRAADAQAKVSAADKAKTESDKKAADLAAQLQSTKAALPEQTKALQEALLEAQQENDLLLKQLHQVQEELESYFLKNQESDLGRSKLQDRLDRVLMRLPTWADAEQINATEVVHEPKHRCLRLELQNLWVSQDPPVNSLGFLLGNRDGVPYMEFRPEGQGKAGVAQNLLPWPEEFKDEQGDRLLLAPGAPGAIGKAQAKVVSELSAVQWRMVKGLLVMIGSQVNRLNLREPAERMYWVSVTRELTQLLDVISGGVHFHSAEVMAVTQPDVGTEVMRVAIRDLTSRNARVPLCVIELGIKYKALKSGPLPQVFFMDFRPWKGAVLPFVNFKSNSQDEQGEFLRISMARAGRNKNKPQDVYELDAQDVAVIGHIGSVLSKLASEQTFKRFATALGQDLWMQELQEVGSLLELNAQLEGAL